MKIHGGGSRIRETFEGIGLTENLEPTYQESMESFIYQTGEPVVSYEGIKKKFHVTGILGKENEVWREMKQYILSLSVQTIISIAFVD